MKLEVVPPSEPPPRGRVLAPVDSMEKVADAIVRNLDGAQDSRDDAARLRDEVRLTLDWIKEEGGRILAGRAAHELQSAIKASVHQRDRYLALWHAVVLLLIAIVAFAAGWVAAKYGA